MGSVLTPGPVRNTEIDTSFSDVMKASTKAAMTPERMFGSTMVKNVFSGGDPRLIAASSALKSNAARLAPITRTV